MNGIRSSIIIILTIIFLPLFLALFISLPIPPSFLFRLLLLFLSSFPVLFISLPTVVFSFPVTPSFPFAISSSLHSNSSCIFLLTIFIVSLTIISCSLSVSHFYFPSTFCHFRSSHSHCLFPCFTSCFMAFYSYNPCLISTWLLFTSCYLSFNRRTYLILPITFSFLHFFSPFPILTLQVILPYY